jgi:hypothetical protein
LTAGDQEIALREMARVLKPGGMIGLTFDFGLAASGANEHLPPPHDPPPNSAEALRRYLQPGLVLAGNPFAEDPISGSLFRHATVSYTVASLFLAKPPLEEEVRVPESESGAPIVNLSRVETLPYRIFQSASSQSAVLHGLRAEMGVLQATIREQEQRSTSLDQICAERLAAMHEKDQRADMLEQTAAERLAAMHEKDQAIALLHAELNARGTAFNVPD